MHVRFICGYVNEKKSMKRRGKFSLSVSEKVFVW